MTNEEQKLRELVNGISAFTTRKELMERITALISDGYYPKEFVEWMMLGGHIGIHDRRGYLYSSSLLNLEGFKGDNTIDELFNYYKDNEQ